MGDRAVIGIRTSENAPTLYLYSHWGGMTQERDLRYALDAAAGRIRMQDTSYAMRIIVSYLIGPDWERETGYGLSIGEFSWPDYDYVYVVDLGWHEVVTYAVPMWEVGRVPGPGEVIARTPIDEFRTELRIEAARV